MPRVIRTVVVFGDSLSDIGRKWVTKSGRMARLVNQMRVNDTGRFSDCRNWTDFMYEEAGGASLLGNDADSSYERSQQHMSITQAAVVTPAGGQVPRWCYLNYAEGGACGDTPREKAPFLGTFQDQVDTFEQQYLQSRGLRDFLFIIWFGANDLFTANRPAVEMGAVANVVASVQRNRLRQMVQAADPNPGFLFVNLARPLTAVRYQQRLERAKASLVAAVRAGTQQGVEMVDMARIQPLWRPAASSRRFLGTNARLAVSIANTHHIAVEELQALEAQVNALRELEQGVMLYNLELARITRGSGDRLAELGSCITEQAVEALVSGTNRILNAGAATAAAGHISARTYDRLRQGGYRANITTIDEVHPTDEMYRLIWHEIRSEILRADWTFGTLPGAAAAGMLSQLAGPTAQARANFNALMQTDFNAARRGLRHVDPPRRG